MVGIAESAARRAWADQAVVIVASATASSATPSLTEQGDLILDFLDCIGIGSMLFVPLGAGPECLGNLVLTRARASPTGPRSRPATAADIGHDLGRAILNARTFEREHELVEELQALDTYKSQLIATVSHELKNPLTAITGHLEMLESVPELSDQVKGSLDAMDRGADRLARVIEDLLLLSKVGDPNTPIIPVPVDLGRVVDEVLDLSSMAARRKSLDIGVETPDEPVVATGDPEEIDRVCANLVSNAVKYTPDGRSITVVAVPRGRRGRAALHRRGHRHLARPTRSTCSASSSAPPTPRRSPSPAPAWA